jgi:hypothetical protein
MAHPRWRCSRNNRSLRLRSGSQAGLGYVGGLGAASPEEPRYNDTLDAYFTVGLRVVLIVDEEYVGADR